MTTLFAFLHHLMAFTLVAAIAVEFVLIRQELTLASARRLLVTDAVVRVAGIDPGRLEAVEPEHLKGIAEPVPLYAVAAA